MDSEQVLLSENAKACKEVDPGWSYELVGIDIDLETYCKAYSHRPPSMSTFDPADSANACLDSFSEHFKGEIPEA
jgi:hypothetical protein